MPAAREGVPTTMMSPLTATLSNIAPSEAISLAFSVRAPLQPPGGFTNAYVTVGSQVRVNRNTGRTTMVSPLTPRLPPKKSLTGVPATVSLAFSVSVPVQPPTGLTNTYAVRCPALASGATTMVSTLA